MDTAFTANALNVPTANHIGIISKPLYVKLLQTTAITLAGFVGGQTATVSFLTIPALLKARSASLLARQWRAFFNRGLIIGPGCIMPSSVIFFWLAWREPTWRTLSAKLFTTAGALLLSTVPYTTFLVNPTNKELKKRSDEANAATMDMEKSTVEESWEGEGIGAWFKREYGSKRTTQDQQSTHQLVDSWAWLNLGRGIGCVVAGVAGCWAVVSEDLSFFE